MVVSVWATDNRNKCVVSYGFIKTVVESFCLVTFVIAGIGRQKFCTV